MNSTMVNTLPKLTVLIINNDPDVCKLLSRMLDKIKIVEYIGDALNSVEGIELVKSLSPNIVLLDIDLAGKNGFDLLESLPTQSMPMIILVSASKDSAVQAFEIGAVDYLVKPVTTGRLNLAMERAAERYNKEASLLTSPAGTTLDTIDQMAQKSDVEEASQEIMKALRLNVNLSYMEKVSCRRGSRIQFVEMDQVKYFAARDRYVMAITAEEEYLTTHTLNQLEKDLDPTLYLRIHRSYIVRLSDISSFGPNSLGKQMVELLDGSELPISRTYIKAFRSKFGLYR